MSHAGPFLTTGAHLDETVGAVRRRLLEDGVPAPRALFLLATGGGSLIESMRAHQEVQWQDVPGVPAPWSETVLHAGQLGRLQAWVIEDVSSEPAALGSAPWAAAFPVWLAASAGASLCVLASAGTALAAPGEFALVRDHLNLSAANPLVGLGPSALGPLFPDTSQLHHLGLRHAALATAHRLGITISEAVTACLPGPALETPAEHRMAARLGAEVAVQGLATPLLAAAHAGLSCLTVVALVDAAPCAPGEPGDGDGHAGPTDPVRLVERAAELQPKLESFLAALAEDLASAADVSSSETTGPEPS